MQNLNSNSDFFLAVQNQPIPLSRSLYLNLKLIPVSQNFTLKLIHLVLNLIPAMKNSNSNWAKAMTMFSPCTDHVLPYGPCFYPVFTYLVGSETRNRRYLSKNMEKHRHTEFE